MIRRCLAVMVFASAAVAQTKWPNTLQTWFPDGTALEIHTESSDKNSPLSTSGSVAVGAGNDVHRVVLDKQGGILFGYDIEARKTAVGTVAMRIKPVDQDKLRAEKWFPKDKAPKTVSTLTAARDFPPLHIGDQVQVDILYHPVTGEKIFDVIRISNDPPPGSAPRSKPEGDQFSLESVRVAINGKPVHEPDSAWLTGRGAVISLPGRGSYYFALSPPTAYAFQASGWVDHTVLRFHAGADLVEVFGKSNILQKSDYGTVWVYHEPVAEGQPETLKSFLIGTADDVTRLIPKKKHKEE